MPPPDVATARYGLLHILYSINATADALQTSRPAIYDFVRKGKLELVKLGPKKSRITADSIVKLLDELRGLAG
jgi:predicted site-specific integrase-resolvase